MSGVWSSVDVRNVTKKTRVLKKDWTTSSKYLNHSRFNSQHDWGDLYDHFLSTMNKHSYELQKV